MTHINMNGTNDCRAYIDKLEFFGTNYGVKWSGQSGWWIIETVESYNGHRGIYGAFLGWFQSNSFGGTNYSNVPIGAVTHVEEPTLGRIYSPKQYFGAWAEGKTFAGAAWWSRNTPNFQAVGDPLIKR